MNSPDDSASGTSFGKGPVSRVGSPSGGSTFTTSAPRSANALPHIEPAGPRLYSTTLMSDSAPADIFASISVSVVSVVIGGSRRALAC